MCKRQHLPSSLPCLTAGERQQRSGLHILKQYQQSKLFQQDQNKNGGFHLQSRLPLPFDDRIDGILSISRGFGDYDLKNKGLISEPHITKKLIDNNLNYCILASDGVWDTLNLDDVSKITNENKNHFNDIAKIIVETAMKKGSEDNISCIVIELNKRIQ